MSETWGDLPKSQIDPSTVDEEIDTKIQTHLDDPDAHIETGQSLQSHKAAEIIDHLAKSIVEDKFADGSVSARSMLMDKIQIWPAFESLDAWTGSGPGSTDLYLGAFVVASGITPNTPYHYYAPCDLQGIAFKDKHPTFEILCSVNWYEDQEIYFGVGDPFSDFLGFKVVENVIYCCVVIGETEYLDEIVDLDPGYKHTYRVTAVANNEIEFYLDEVLIYTFSSASLTADEVVVLFYFYLKPTTSTDIGMLILDLRYFQDR